MSGLVEISTLLMFELGSYVLITGLIYLGLTVFLIYLGLSVFFKIKKMVKND